MSEKPNDTAGDRLFIRERVLHATMWPLPLQFLLVMLARGSAVSGSLGNLDHEVGRGPFRVSRDRRLSQRGGLHIAETGYELRPLRHRPCLTVHAAGVPVLQDHAWMMRVARNVTDVSDGVLRAKRYLILDRDAKYTGLSREKVLK